MVQEVLHWLGWLHKLRVLKMLQEWREALLLMSLHVLHLLLQFQLSQRHLPLDQPLARLPAPVPRADAKLRCFVALPRGATVWRLRALWERLCLRLLLILVVSAH